MILNEFAILMRHEKCDFKNWTLPKTLVVSQVNKARRVKQFEIINFPEEIKFFLKKEPPLLQEPLAQPVLSVELFISDLIV